MILGLETSCDETALALFDPACGIAGEWVHSQVELHSEHGGVVPDIATREHLRKLGPLLERAVHSGSWGEVTQVAVTRGPGLAACLALGAAAAKAIARALRVPVVGVNHLRAHAWSPFLCVHAGDPGGFEGRLASLLPHLGLIVSGGNTLLFSLSAGRALRQVSATRDDAAGEALDKGAKLLGLGYPGGPAIERLALSGRTGAFEFPRGIGGDGELDFSFSGLKTSLRYRIQAMEESAVRRSLPDICAGYQEAVVGALCAKAERALSRGGYRSLGLSGGVANNAALRAAMESAARGAGVRFLAAEPRHTGDNAAMIAFTAWADADDAARFAGSALRVEPGAYL
ncbi:MAG TPA: tRNA (adenosine(37)-N6)-threonylcarbamoyltransferase complex transferase subunit TsaD [Opitutaceae bacterium]|nr:tRNA (adenosine(37)-N6)-threonylcarbamoyltransferase complex transferase subunit TsaD [Opitutaceae bacterium]